MISTNGLYERCFARAENARSGELFATSELVPVEWQEWQLESDPQHLA